MVRGSLETAPITVRHQTPMPRGRTPSDSGISDRAVLVKGVSPLGDSILGPLPLNWPKGSCVRARASEEAGVNVERPEPKARTNDVDAGDERRRLLIRNRQRVLPVWG